jgi:PAS domain S-box-containing protein
MNQLWLDTPQSDVEEFFDLALDMMVIAGFDGYYRRVNAAYERTLGYPLQELLSRPFADFIHPEDRPSVLGTFRHVVGGDGDDVIGFEARAIHADGSARWFRWNSRTMPERGLIFAVGRDVTDQRRADAELREVRRLVETGRDELAASRARIAAAADDVRRRVVRDLHDGAQQRLVHTVVTLKLARKALDDAQDAAPALVAEALDNAERALAEVRELAHVAKHARAGHAEVIARIEDGTLAVRVRDDGLGGARPEGTGLVGLADRLAAVDGRLRVESFTDGGTLIAADIPIDRAGR